MDDYELGYIHGRYGHASFWTVMLVLGIIALLGLIGESNRKAKVSTHNECLAILTTAGLTKSEIRNLTDGQVAEKCGFLPKVRVNTAWYRNRERPVGVAAKSSEYLACAEKFKAKGLTYEDLAQSSDVEVAIICDAVPAHH